MFCKIIVRKRGIILTISILAGGRSRRMGQNKALMPFHGIPLIQRVVSRLAPIASEMNIISDEEKDYKFLNLPVIPDKIPGKGVLGGIYTAFLVSKSAYVAPAGCDLPFVSAKLLLAELRLIAESDVDVVIPESQNGLEPLHAVYRKDTCLPMIEKSLLKGDNRIISWFGNARVRTIPQSEIKLLDDDPRIFLNLNHPEEFTQAVELSDSE